MNGKKVCVGGGRPGPGRHRWYLNTHTGWHNMYKAAKGFGGFVWLVQPNFMKFSSLLEHYVFVTDIRPGGWIKKEEEISQYTPSLGCKECIRKCDLCISYHSTSSLLQVNIRKYIPTVRWILTVLKSILPWYLMHCVMSAQTGHTFEMGVWKVSTGNVFIRENLQQ